MTQKKKFYTSQIARKKHEWVPRRGKIPRGVFDFHGRGGKRDAKVGKGV